MKKLFLSILLLLVFTTNLNAATYYVKTTGSDSNNCTQAQSASTPKLTITSALACLGTSAGAGANHTVEVWVGTYAEQLENVIPSGTSWSAPFTLRAKAGDVVTIQGPSGQRTIYYDSGGAQYAIIDGFILDGVNQGIGPGVVTFSAISEIIFRNNEVKNTSTPGAPNLGGNHVYISLTASNIQILNNTLHDGTGWGHGVYIEGSNNLIEGNHIYNTGGFGMQVFNAIDNQANNNIVRNNRIHDFGLLTVTAAGITLSAGTGNQAYNNLVYNGQGVNNDGGIGISAGGSSGSLIYSNTVYSNTWIGLDATGSTNAIIKNNLIIGNAPNTDFTGSEGGTPPVGLTQSNNITTGSAASHFVNAAGGNFSLISTSPAINAGTASIASGVTACANGAAPDIGAIETLSNPTATVDGTALLITITNNCTSQVLPASSVTGFTVKRAGSADAISSLSRSGSNSFVGVLADAFTAGQACLFSYAQSTGNAFSDNNIGGITTSNQELFDMVDAGCTNITSGVGVGSVALSRWRFYLLQGATDTAWTAKCNENSTNCTVSPGSRLWFRGKIRNNSGNNYPAFNYRTRARYNGGSYVTLTSSYVNNIKSLGTATQPGTVISQGAALTADLLTSDETTNVAGIAVKDSSSIPSVTLNDASEIEVAQAIDISTSAVVGDTYEFCPFDDAGTALTCATPAKITIGDYRSIY